jgi:hypothetical protein
MIRRSVTVLDHPCIGADRPRGLQAVEARRIFSQSAREGGKVVSPPFYPHGTSLVLISVRG